MARLILEGFATPQDAAAVSNLLRRMVIKTQYTLDEDLERKVQWKIQPGGSVAYDGDVTINVQEIPYEEEVNPQA